MEATSLTGGAPREAPVGILVGGGVPVSRQDVSVDTSYVTGGTVATRRHRGLRPEEVVEIMGVILPPGAGFPDGLPVEPTSLMNAPNPIGTRLQRIPGQGNLGASTRAAGDATLNLTSGIGGGIPWARDPGLVQRLQLATIAKVRWEREQLRRQLAKARATRPATAPADRDRLDRLEALAAQLRRESERLSREGKELRRRREQWEADMVAQTTFIALTQTMDPSLYEPPPEPESQQ